MISVKVYDSLWTIDETQKVAQMKVALPTFFKQKHAEQEKYTAYRGCLIVAGYAVFDRVRTRVVSMYLYDPNRKDSFCLSPKKDKNTVWAAKKYIDFILDRGEYTYGIDKS